MDADTGKVVLAAVAGIGGAAVLLDWILKTAISILTLWYLWRKIHPRKKNKSNESEDDAME